MNFIPQPIDTHYIGGGRWVKTQNHDKTFTEEPMNEKTVWELGPTNVTCAFCLRVATHYIVKIRMSGRLLAVCDEHSEK